MALAYNEREDGRQVVVNAVHLVIRGKDKSEYTADEQWACVAKLERLRETMVAKGGSLSSAWWVECEMRKNGSSQGSYDYYYFHMDPTTGKVQRFRSTTEVARFLGLEAPAKKKPPAKKSAPSPPPVAAAAADPVESESL